MFSGKKEGRPVRAAFDPLFRPFTKKSQRSTPSPHLAVKEAKFEERRLSLLKTGSVAFGTLNLGESIG
jgi:hypothetical protein